MSLRSMGPVAPSVARNSGRRGNPRRDSARARAREVGQSRGRTSSVAYLHRRIAEAPVEGGTEGVRNEASPALARAGEPASHGASATPCARAVRPRPRPVHGHEAPSIRMRKSSNDVLPNLAVLSAIQIGPSAGARSCVVGSQRSSLVVPRKEPIPTRISSAGRPRARRTTESSGPESPPWRGASQAHRKNGRRRRPAESASFLSLVALCHARRITVPVGFPARTSRRS
jgi:hypothetical protein